MLLSRKRLLPLLFYWLYLTINQLPGYSQNACDRQSTGGGFNTPQRVCLGLPVTATNQPSSLSAIGYTFDYNGSGIPANPQSSATYTYTKPGSFTILQTGSSGGAGTTLCKVIEVLPVKPISFNVVVCSGRKATLTFTLDAETARYDRIIINWGDGLPSSDVPLSGNITSGIASHTYPSTGNPVVSVTGAYIGACEGPVSTQTISVKDISLGAPTIQELASSPTSVALKYQAAAGSVVTLYQRNSAGNYVATGQTAASTGAGSFSVNGVSASVENCFQVSVQDICGGTELRSAGVCSIPLAVSAASKQNTLSWPAYTGTDQARLYRLTKNGGSLTNRSAGSTSYVDAADIQCGVTYCYTAELSFNTAVTIVKSAPVCVVGQNTEPPATPIRAFVSVEADGVKVQTTLADPAPTSYTLLVTRADGSGGPFTSLGQVSTDRSYTDKTANSDAQSYCYRTAIQTNCGVTSAYTPPACTVYLTTPDNNALDWTALSPFSGTGVSGYQIIKIDPTTGLSSKDDVGNNTHWEPKPGQVDTQTYLYQIVAYDANGIESYSNPILVLLAPKLFVPNAFSPNGDGLNDGFMAQGAFWETFSMTIFSRWGETLFNTIDPLSKGWDGLLPNGSTAANGYYTYRVEIKDLKGQTYVRTGRVLLMR